MSYRATARTGIGAARYETEPLGRVHCSSTPAATPLSSRLRSERVYPPTVVQVAFVRALFPGAVVPPTWDAAARLIRRGLQEAWQQ